MCRREKLLGGKTYYPRLVSLSLGTSFALWFGLVIQIKYNSGLSGSKQSIADRHIPLVDNITLRVIIDLNEPNTKKMLQM